MTLGALLSDLEGRLPTVASILLFRSLPFVAYLVCLVCAARKLPWPRRLVLGLGAAIAIAIAFRADPRTRTLLQWAPVVGAYFVLGGVLVHRLAVWLPARAIKGGAVLALCAALFVVLPAALVHHPFVVAWLILGWEVMLSAHSYCVDVSSSGERPSLADCLFFLLINPTFIYAERGAPLPRESAAPVGALRVVLGAIAMLGRDAALFVVGALAFLTTSHLGDSGAVSYARFVCTQLVLVLGLYCAHAGLASIQIGWMRVLGHGVPERYRYPLFASGPQDFWLRWNVWVSRWAQRYIYVPVAHAIVRRRGGRVGPIIAVMAAFLGVGLLHDLGVYAFRLHDGDRGNPSLRLTLVFLLLGLVVVTWSEVARIAARLVRDATPRAASALGVVSRLVWINAVCALAALALPVLRSGMFAPAIEAVLRRLAHLG